MTYPPSPFPAEETDPRLLEALRILNQISTSINHIGADDSSPHDFSLQLIVNSAIHVVPGSSAVIYTYDQASGTFETHPQMPIQLYFAPAPAQREPRPYGSV